MRHSLNIMSGRTDRKRPVVGRMIHGPDSRGTMIHPAGLDSRNMECVDFTTVCRQYISELADFLSSLISFRWRPAASLLCLLVIGRCGRTFRRHRQMHDGDRRIVLDLLARAVMETGHPEPGTISTKPDHTGTRTHQLLQTHVSERGDEKCDFGVDFAKVAWEGDVVDW